MAARRPASESAEVTPTPADTGEVAPAAVATDPIPAAPDSIPVVDADEPVVEAREQRVAPAQQVIYVEAPKPFIARGNRGFGVLIALLATVVFAVLYTVALVLTELIQNAGKASLDFITSLDFYAPVLMFAVGFILLVLIVNRAGWAAHVIGSIFVGLVTYFGGTGLILLLHVNQIPSNQVSQAFNGVLFSSTLIIAALLGREVSLWLGFAVAAHGRKVKARNVEARVLYDQEVAAKRAEYEQANARTIESAPERTEPAAPSEPAL
jgi:hypothetical protein